MGIEELIAEANSWRNEDINDDSTEQVSEEVTSLIARLTDALEFVTDNYVLKSWSSIFEILDEAYPKDVFLVLPNNGSRDSVLRIIALIRLLDRERTRAQVAESRLEAVTAPTESEREVLLGVIAEERASVGGGVPVPWSYWAEESRHEMEKAANAILSAGFRLPVVPAPVKGGGTLADLIDAVIAEWEDNQCSDRPKESKPLADTVADAVAGFVSAPTGDDPAQLHNAIRETVIAWEDYGGNIERMLKARLYGFRLPVVSVPVYEYGTRIVGEPGVYVAESKDQAVEDTNLWNHLRMLNPRSEFVRSPKRVWEVVPVGVDNP